MLRDGAGFGARARGVLSVLATSTGPVLLHSSVREMRTAAPKKKVLSSMRSEWQTVFAHGKQQLQRTVLLKDRCKFTDFQNFREIHTMMEQSEYAVTDAARSLLESWHPPFAWSANLESVFADVQSAIKRTCSSEQTSMQSMMSLAVRSLDRRVCTDDASPTPMTLEPNDFLGKQTANLKQKIWCPESCSP